MDKLRLLRTCDACPEQYDVYIGDDCIGYMRLRHGCFYAQYRGLNVFECEPRGDGSFYDDERDTWLNLASAAIIKAHIAFNQERDFLANKLFVIEDARPEIRFE